MGSRMYGARGDDEDWEVGWLVGSLVDYGKVV